MRRVLVATMLSAIALSPFGAEASQSVSGSIMSPTRFTDGTGGWPGLGRKLYTLSNETNGLISYTFAVDPDTIGSEFTLGNVADATGAADLDIYFYVYLGDDVVGTTAPLTAEEGEFQTVGAGGETGIVPQEATMAIVFTPNGVNSTFTYTAG